MFRKSSMVFGVCVLAAGMLGGALATALAPQPAQAAPLMAFAAPMTVTVMDVPNIGFPGITTTAVKVSDVDQFTVREAGSLVEVTHQGKLMLDTIAGATGVIFELRVDDVPAPAPLGTVHLNSDDVDQHVPATFSGYWQNLTAGEHTVSIWARVSGANALATARVIIDPGGWSDNNVVVKEYLPFGSSYLPNIIN